ncbi:hypothetical protein PoB_006342600 [Plakobranchus ocellatus]|uniref:Uncharacterized protein n=1 Tax=Plakobranchus ocellatus TaxID=259542 RepID=A0AAV4CYN3_9GAST|nr:hypothetical protein PoB_006342600 [Plakobranchus ocellatus]
MFALPNTCYPIPNVTYCVRLSDAELFRFTSLLVWVYTLASAYLTFVSKVRSQTDQEPVHNKVISGFQALCQARAPVAGLEPATEGSADLRADSLATVPPTPRTI